MARGGDNTLTTLLLLGVLGVGGYMYWPQIKAAIGSGGGGGELPTDPNMQNTMSVWQHARCGMGLEPNDWQAFRLYEQQRGYSTPTFAPAGWGYTCDGGSYY